MVKTFFLFSREVFELEISPIPIFASSFQGLLDEQVKFSLRPTQQLTFDGLKQLPIETNFVEFFFKIPQRQKSFIISLMSAFALAGEII